MASGLVGWFVAETGGNQREIMFADQSTVFHVASAVHIMAAKRASHRHRARMRTAALEPPF
jgi:hypothetical protein